MGSTDDILSASKMDLDSDSDLETGLANGVAAHNVPGEGEGGEALKPVDEPPFVSEDATKTVVKNVPIGNTYAAKKTVAQGMMDIALITANANQLRYLIEFGSESRTFVLAVVLICVSLLIQVAVGVSLIFKGRHDMKDEAKHDRANFLNNIVVVGVFLVTIINVFVASFSIDGRATPIVPSIPAAGGVVQDAIDNRGL